MNPTIECLLNRYLRRTLVLLEEKQQGNGQIVFNFELYFAYSLFGTMGVMRRYRR